MAFTVTTDATREMRGSFVSSMSCTAFTPAANSLLLFAFSSLDATQPTSLTGHGTWSNTGVSVAGTVVNGFLWLCKVGASPSSAVVTANFASGFGTGIVFEISGHDDTETLGNIVVQSDTKAIYFNAAGTLGLDTPLAAFGAGNLGVSLGFSGGSETTFTPDSPLAEDHETAGATAYEVCVASSETEDVSPSFTTSGAYRESAMIAIEILAAGVGGGGGIEALRRRREGY